MDVMKCDDMLIGRDDERTIMILVQEAPVPEKSRAGENHRRGERSHASRRQSVSRVGSGIVDCLVPGGGKAHQFSAWHGDVASYGAIVDTGSEMRRSWACEKGDGGDGELGRGKNRTGLKILVVLLFLLA